MKKFSIYIFFTLLLFLTSCEIQELGTISSIEQARKRAVGIWTFTESRLGVWLRYVIHADGSFVTYAASPRQDNWGQISGKGKWEIFTDKYVNTGKRYYGIKFMDNGIHRHRLSIFERGNKLALVDPRGGYILTLKKGNKFPFSK